MNEPPQELTAEVVIATLNMIGLDYERSIPKREIFALAKDFIQLPVPEVIQLLQTENLDYRLTAVSILDWKARHKKTPESEKEAIYEAYINNHNWIDDWGLVDRAAPYVVGGYLFDKPRIPLYQLAASKNPFARRTAIVSTYFFIRKNDVEDTFKIAEILVHDSDQAVQTAVGSWIREAGKRDEARLRSFLDKFAETMPRITLRYAIEKFDPETKALYMNMKQKNP